jgi:hypothetical protein
MNDKPVFEIVRDKRLLKSLSKKGHFTFPAQFGGNSNQIDERVNEVNKPMRFKQYRFYLCAFQCIKMLAAIV